MPQHHHPDRFVNPYAFVGLPTALPRHEPPGHDTWRPGTVSGQLEVTWTLKTPLLLPEGAAREGWIEADGRVAIPGSAMKGAIRSLHETIFNGCLRIVDQDFVPGYRDAARADHQSDAHPGTGEWRLAVVAESSDGVAKRVRLCDSRAVWVEATALKRAWSGKPLPSTSDIIDLAGEEEPSELRGANGAELLVVRRASRVGMLTPTTKGALPEIAAPGAKVLLVSDTAARKRDRAHKSARGRAFWAVGTLTAEEAVIDQDAWRSYVRTVAGARDRTEQRRTEQTGGGGNRFRDVSWWPDTTGPLDNFNRASVPLARRKEVSGFLYVGDVVWVKLSGASTVQAIKHSVLWRHPGAGTVAERIPEAALPCTRPYPDPKYHGPIGLCLSCLIFGSADTEGEGRDEGRQDSYAGHVRIGPARATKVVTLRVVQLAPMGTPHPGAGMFYLDRTEPGRDREPGDLPSHWGSSSDEERPRRLRGRKYYWHGDPDQQASTWGSPSAKRRFEARPHQELAPNGKQSEFVRRAELLPVGTELKQTITVSGLTPEQVATLCAAIDPQRVLGRLPGADGRTFGTHLGGGKGLGLGSATAVVTERLHTAAERYLGTPESAAPTKVPALNLLDLRRGEAKQLTSYAAQLARLLDVTGPREWVHHLSYPPGATWDAVNTKLFDESFEFFRENSGEQLARSSRRYLPLPEVPNDLRSSYDPSLPVARQQPPRRPAGGRS